MPEETNVNPEVNGEESVDQPENPPVNETPSVEKPKKVKTEKNTKTTLDLLNDAFQDAKTEDRRQEVLKAIKAHKDAAELATKVLG